MAIHIKEMIVVEGINDKDAVLRAISAFVVTTGGLRGNESLFDLWRPFVDACGICLLTDPDRPGERIRQRLSTLYPTARQARLPKKACLGKKRLGIAYATPEAIRTALYEAGCHTIPQPVSIQMEDLFALHLSGHPSSALRRQQLAEALSIPYADSRTLLNQLNALNMDHHAVRSVLEKGESR